jgi:hypothetical protein
VSFSVHFPPALSSCFWNEKNMIPSPIRCFN